MKRVLVCNYAGEMDEVLHLFPSDRMARTAAVLRQQGVQAVVWDLANLSDLERLGSGFAATLGSLSFGETCPEYEAVVAREADAVLAAGFDALFMNLWQGGGFKFSMDVARAVKRRDGTVPIYAVGQKVDWFADHILRLGGRSLDGLILGLGYEAVRCLARGASIRDAPGTVFADGATLGRTRRRVLDVDRVPAPLYDPGVYRHIEHKAPVYPLALSNQACPNRCAFCVRPENYGRAVRVRDAEGVVAEVRGLLDGVGATHFHIEDSTPPPGSLTRLAAAVVRGGLAGRVWFSGFCRADSGGAEDFALLRRAGFLSLFFGLESLDDERLKALRKGVTYATMAATLREAHAAGLHTVGSLMFPTPGETRRSMDATLERLGLLRPHLDAVLTHPAGVYPPTDWGRKPGAHGIVLADDYVTASVIYPVKHLVPAKLWKPFPFSYGIMGKPAAETTFADIIGAHESFVARVRTEHRYPPVPDHYVLLAHRLGQEPAALAKQLVELTIRRDYAGMRRALHLPAGAGGRA